MNTQIDKNITKLIIPLNNADETYDIKVKYNYCLIKSVSHVHDGIKNLFDNKKRKFYYKIEPLIKGTNLH